MCVAVYFVGYIAINKLLLLIIQILVGALVYVGINTLIKNENLAYFYNILKNVVKSGFNKKRKTRKEGENK